eukprot:gene5021-5384_t
MTGSLPRQIGVFKSLKTLDFSQNNITGTLPEEIGNLSSIRIISLQNNQFTGPLPTSFGNIPHLQTLNLHVNYFNGTLPDSLYTIQELKVLQLEQNQLYGTISSNISQLTNLLELLIQLNAFTGTLPSSLGKLKHLKAIDFSSNYFNGTLPSTIGNLKNLTTLIGGGNYLHGSLPSEIGQLRRLILLDLTVNNFTGQIPESVANLTRIEQFYLNDNQFFGTIPNTFPGINTKDLFSIDLSYNHLTGTIPLTIFHWKKLQFFSIQYNYFHGEFPWNITNFPRLIVFQIGNNQFYGSVPSVNKFDNFTRMVSFNIASNTFTGLSPSGNWSILTEYIVYNNYLSGSINDILSQSNFLNLFEISNNYLTGSIPLWFANKNQLGYVNMTSNFLTGSLDQLFGNKIFFPDLTQLSLSHNDFSGTIPDTIFQISHLHGIFLNDNRLSGTLPGSISQLHELEVLLVQNNLLTGNFPAILSSPSLENVDISNNLLSGTLPINFYSNSSLISLSIGTNCFHGSLPLQLCNMRKVEVFAFNGLSTASQCRLQLFPGKAQEADEVAAAQHHGKSFIGFMIRLIIWRRELYSVTASSAAVRPSFSSFFVVFDDANNTSNIKNLTIFLQRVRILSVVLGGIILFVFLPLFSSLGIFYSQYENKYAWKVSGLLLTGVNAALSLEIVLFLLLVFIVAYFQFVFHYRDFDFMRIKSFNFLSSDRIRGSATSATSASTAADSSNSASLGSFPGRLTIITLFLVGLLDCLCMIIVDIVYVYVIITYDTSIIILSEMLLALVKTLLNNVLIWRAVPTIKRFLQKNLLPTSTATSLTLSSSEESFYFTRLDISFITIMILLNNIIFPIFAVFIVSPDCFYTALFQPADVSSSYTYTICDRYAGRFYVNYCYLYQTLTQDSSYNPPFMYNYQCASTIFINYVSVFILMYTVEGIVLPLCKLVIKFINEVDDDEQTQDELYQDHNELSSASQSSYSHNSSHHRQSQSQNQSRITMTKSMHARESVSMAKALQSRISSLLLPANLKSLTPNLRDEGKIGKNYQESILFDKNRLAVRLNAYLVVMLSFGALFPPLALIVCVTIFTVTIYEEIVIGRLLYESERLGYVWYKRQLEKDCSGIEDSLKYTLWSLIPVSSALYAYIIFDTWGDEEGGFNAIIPALCMLFVPTILLVALKKNRFFSSIWKNGFRCPFTSPPAKSNEEKSESEDARNTISSRFTESKEDAVRGSEIEVPSLHTRGSMEVVSNPILIKDKDMEAPPPPLPSPSASPSTKKRVGFSESSK